MATRDPSQGLESPSTIFRRQNSVIITDCTACTVLVCVRHELTPLKQRRLVYAFIYCCYLFISFYYDVKAVQ